MSESKSQAVSRLAIPPERKTRRRSGPLALIVIVLVLLLLGGAAFQFTRQKDRAPIPNPNKMGKAASPAAVMPSKPPPAPRPGEPLLTVSGYIIPRERIEISPRFPGTVKWIGVKKGDAVKKGDILVQLEDDEYRARLLEAQGRLALAEANLRNAEANLQRQQELARKDVESARALDDAQRARDVALAEVKIARGQLDLAQTWLDWCTIRAPVDGTILEKLVDPNELVVPQSYGGTRGPSTALVSLANLDDLQVEIDLNEADTPKVRLGQRCRVSPEAYPDRRYSGHVAEIAPEANRSKGTLQVKVQIENPDRFLTPELTARVDFLAE